MSATNLLKTIGDNIKDTRRGLGMKGETLAKELKIGKSAISQMENGSMDFRISVLHNIAELLKTDVCKLLALPLIESTDQLISIPPKQEYILVHRIVIDELINQMQKMKGYQTEAFIP